MATPRTGGLMQVLEEENIGIKDYLSSLFDSEDRIDLNSVLKLCSDFICICSDSMSDELEADIHEALGEQFKDRLNEFTAYDASLPIVRVIWLFNTWLSILGISFPLIERIYNDSVEKVICEDEKAQVRREIINLFHSGVTFRRLSKEYESFAQDSIREIKKLVDEYDGTLERVMSSGNTIVEITNRITAYNDSIKNLKTSSGTLLNQYKEKEQAKKKLEYEYKKLLTEKDKLENNISRQNKSCSELENLIKSSESNNVNAESVRHAEAQAQALENEFTGLDSENTELSDKLKSLSLSTTYLQEMLTVLQGTDVNSYTKVCADNKAYMANYNTQRDRFCEVEAEYKDLSKMLSTNSRLSEIAAIKENMKLAHGTYLSKSEEYERFHATENEFNELEAANAKKLDQLDTEIGELTQFKIKMVREYKQNHSALNLCITHLSDVKEKMDSGILNYVESGKSKLLTLVNELFSILERCA